MHVFVIIASSPSNDVIPLEDISMYETVFGSFMFLKEVMKSQLSNMSFDFVDFVFICRVNLD